MAPPLETPTSQSPVDQATRHSLRSAVDDLGARLVEVCVADFSSNARGKTVSRDDFLDMGGCRLASVVLGLAITGANPENLYGMVLPESFRDVDLVPDPETLVPLIGRDHVASVLAEPYGALRAEKSGREFDANEISPRGALRRVLEKLDQKGLRATVAPEMEFYLVQRRPGGAAHELIAPTPDAHSPAREIACEPDSVERAGYFGEYFDDLFAACEKWRIPVTGYAHESALSQYEVNFHHGEPLALADAVFRFKRLARMVAARHGYLASFLAKPYLNEPGAGTHWHFSLQTAKGHNAFLEETSERDSPELVHFIAGLVAHAPAATAIFAPYDISYDRLRHSDSSPTHANWGYDDRTSAFRVPNSSPANRRVENRLPGGDASPYLTVATTLGLGLHGMDQRLQPSRLAAELPGSLGSALDALQGDEVLREVLGPHLVDLFCAVKRCETSLRNAVADPRNAWDLPVLTEQA
jgi:glutamine synthetase